MKKQKIILISDLWGKKKCQWIKEYENILSKHFEVKYYDSSLLGNIDTKEFVEEKIHQQFVDGGIEKAIKNLIKIEKDKVIVLGFSIGGTIAWKASMAGLNVQYLFAISATRLRYETDKPLTKIDLFYAENDLFKPEKVWFKNFGIAEYIFKHADHEFYRDKNTAKKVCDFIVNSTATF